MSWVKGKRRWAQGIGLVLHPPDHRAATTGCVGTGEFLGSGAGGETVVMWADGSIRHMFPGARLGWNELLPPKSDADPSETVTVRWVPIALCTADDALRDSMAHD